MRSVTSVEQLLTQVDAVSPGRTGDAFSIWVPESLTFNSEPIAQNVAMAILGDRLLGKGFYPAGFESGVAGRRYNYRFEGL
jgi:hypothetical protein